MAAFNYTRGATPSQLLIKDGIWDSQGTEPDELPSGDNAWESPDIGVFTTPQTGLMATSALNGSINYSDLSGAEAYVYVRITNISAAASFGTEVLKVYWAHASTALQWPNPWDGLMADTAATNSPALGGPVGSVRPRPSARYHGRRASGLDRRPAPARLFGRRRRRQAARSFLSAGADRRRRRLSLRNDRTGTVELQRLRQPVTRSGISCHECAQQPGHRLAQCPDHRGHRANRHQPPVGRARRQLRAGR